MTHNKSTCAHCATNPHSHDSLAYKLHCLQQSHPTNLVHHDRKYYHQNNIHLPDVEEVLFDRYVDPFCDTVILLMQVTSKCGILGAALIM